MPDSPILGWWPASQQVMVGLESEEAGAYQKRVGQMRLLGELYNYRVVDSR